MPNSDERKKDQPASRAQGSLEPKLEIPRRVRLVSFRPLLFALNVLTLTLVLFCLMSVDFVGFNLSQAAQAAPYTLFVVALLDSLVVGVLIVKSRLGGARLVGSIFLVFYGVGTFLTAIESAYLPTVLPPGLAVRLLVNGAITAGVFSGLAVWLHGRMRNGVLAQASSKKLSMPLTEWVWKFVLIGAVWMALFIAFGALVFNPIANYLDPKALQYYASLGIPSWIFVFQPVRAIIWAALTIPLIRLLNLGMGNTAILVGLLYAVLMGTNLLLPSSLPQGLQVPQLAEVMGENFVFGLVVVYVLTLRNRLSDH